MNQYLLIKQGNIHNAVEKEAFTADILIENGTIKKIAPVLEGAVINDAEIIDASGIDVYPGFVDAHCHLGLDGYAVEYAGDDFNEIGDVQKNQQIRQEPSDMDCLKTSFQTQTTHQFRLK